MKPSGLLMMLGTAPLVWLWAATLSAQPPNQVAPGTGREAVAGGDAAAVPSHESLEFFELHVRPVLVEHCQKCHGQKKQEAGLRLDARSAILKGSENGPVAVAGNPSASSLVRAIGYADENLQMPPDGKLPPEAVEALTQWIDLGLPWPAGDTESSSAPAADSWRSHWAFQPIRALPLPVVGNAAWVRSPLDAFVLAKMEQANLAPAEPATRAALLRRATFDLIGLPPTAAKVEAFVADTDPDAFAKVVDRLLALPAYGERWGRHWLDHARYADTKGYVFMEDRKYPFAYKYRDWVVQALNADLPYDQFLIQQIAADRLASAADANTLTALGFLTVGRRFLNVQADIIDDRIDVLCRSTMGLTVTCAHCHDHKFDPITTKDYYSLYGVLASSVDAKEPAEVMAMVDDPQPHNVRIFIRGNSQNLGDEAPRRFLSCLGGDDARPFFQGSGRLELAQAIASADNPLTARVLVNRVWLHYFGAGLVRTPSDFGLRSQPPTHPELLDYLARRFMDEGWSLKKLHRLLLLSSTYQQSSTSTSEKDTRDPDNRLLARMNRRRLDLEALRDALLCVSGALDRSLGGPAVDLTTQPFTNRRTIYGLVERQNLPGMFRTFDFASPDTHSPQRFITTVPQQALFLMNSPFVGQQSQLVAASAEVQAAGEPRDRVTQLYRRVLGRTPTATELQSAVDFVAAEAVQPEPVVVWRYGFGRWDAASGQLASFSELPHYTGQQWQGGPNFPDPALHYVALHADGGHPGNPLAVVRRWTAPHDAVVAIDGTLEHPDAHGDGVEAIIVSSRQGVVGRWIAEHGQAGTAVDRVDVKRGDTIDFVVDPRTSDSNDSFRWAPRLRTLAAEGQPESSVAAWDAQANFSGPLPPHPDAWTRLAQVLLLTNEFVFLD